MSRPKAPKDEKVGTLKDRNGNVWTLIMRMGVQFVEDEHGERFTREWVERKFGPLT